MLASLLNKRSIAIGCLLFVGAQAGVTASATTSTGQSQSKSSLIETFPKWSGSASVGRSNSLYNRQDGSEMSSWDGSANLSMGLPSDYSVSLLTEASNDIKLQESEVTRVRLSASKSKLPLISDRVSLGTAIRWTFPTTKAQQAASYRGGATLGFSAPFNNEYFYFKKLSFTPSVSFTRSFHEFETSISGQINTQYSSSQAFDLIYNFNDVWSFAFSPAHINSWNYRGTMKEYYSHTEELGIQVSQNFGLAFGHTYGVPYRSVFAANGRDYEFELTDDDNSFVYSTMTISF